MRIAIVGGGVSGLVCGALLCAEHEIELFEAEAYAGGHAQTVTIARGNRACDVDTGFMVFNERTYPHFCRLLAQLGVAAQDSDMSFSVRCDRTGLEYQGGDLNGVFAQRRNLWRPSFWGMLRDIARFNRRAVCQLAACDDSTNMADYLRRGGYGQAFIDHYLVPMASAIWSARPDCLLDFPAHFLIRFFHNHGLLQVTGRPRWKTVAGRSARYVEALTRPFASRIRLATPVRRVRRQSTCVVVETDGGEATFDEVVFATHADQTLNLLSDASAEEQAILGTFAYQANEAVLHADARLLPTRQRAWASWNYLLPREPRRPVTVTYDLNRLQDLGADGPICLTLNPAGQVPEGSVLRRFVYHHPVFTTGAVAAQRRHGEISGRRRTHYCGAYWGYGFHEDGVNSALVVARHFGKGLEDCIPAAGPPAGAAWGGGGA